MSNRQTLDDLGSNTALPSSDKASLWRFILPSALGILLFLVPIMVDGKFTIGMGVIADEIKRLSADHILAFITGMTVLSALGSIAVKLLGLSNAGRAEPNRLLALFEVSWFWVAIRAIGALFVLFTFFEFGPSWINNKYTGGTILADLAPTMFIYFLVAVFLLPLLTEYGLMEFIGVFLRKPFQLIFRLPGRSAVDAMASWMGAGTVGVLITSQQYDRGYYNKREAAVIATNFSIVSIAFCLVIAKFLSIDHLFIQYYLVVCIAGIITAIIAPRIPPLSSLANSYHNDQSCELQEENNQSGSNLSFGLQLAQRKAASGPDLFTSLRNSCFNILDIWLGLFPAVMAIGTASLVLAEYTPVFNYLSYPFVFILEALQIPEAVKAAPTMIVGFADMFLPAVLGKGIESELTRFVIAGISVSQLIYMSEIGVLILRSNIPLNLLQLFIIFLIRTLICLPVFAIAGHLIIG